MAQGWIWLHRQLIDWEWYKNSFVKDVFIHLLLKANHKEGKWQGHKIKRGQLITGRRILSSELGFSEQNVRTALNKLKSTNEITVETTSQFSVITINRFNEYNTANQQTNQRPTNDQPTINQRLTTNNNDNNEKNEKNNIHANVENIDRIKKKVSYNDWDSKYGEKYIDVFNQLFGTRYRLTTGRIKKLKLRFKTFTSKQLGQALVNLSESKWHQGDNARGWKASPDFLLRSDEMVDTWLNSKGNKNVK